MKVYEFRLWMEEYPDVHRRIAIGAEQTFEDLHNIILRSVNFDNSQLASFYVCDDEWEKKVEISLIDMDPDESDLIPIMREAKVNDFLGQKGQKLIYEYDFVLMWRFLLELDEIRKGEPNEKLPAVTLSEGAAPDQYETSEKYADDLSDEDSQYIIELRQRNADMFHAAEDDETWDDEEDFDSYGDFDEFG